MEVIGGANAAPRFSVPTPARLPPPPPPQPTWREHIGRTTGRLYYFDSTTRKPAYAKPAELRRQTSEAGTAAVSTHALALASSSGLPLQRGRLRWPMATQWSWHDEANRQYAAEDWQADANRQYEAEMSQRRRRPSGVYNSSNSGSTPAPMLQLARAPADAPVTAPSQASSFVVV